MSFSIHSGRRTQTICKQAISLFSLSLRAATWKEVQPRTLFSFQMPTLKNGIKEISFLDLAFRHRHCKSINSDWQLALIRLGKNCVPRADPKFHSSKFITCFTNNGVQCTKFFWSKIKIWVRDQSAVLIKINLFSHPKIPNEVVEWI